MSDSGHEHGVTGDIEAVGRAIGDRIVERLAGFEDRMAGLEEDLGAEVGRVRSTAQAIDLLADEVRRALQERHEDEVLLGRLASIEQLVRDREAPPAAPVDLGPVSAALADVLEAVAAQSEQVETDGRSLRADLDALRSEIGGATADLGQTDLAPLQRCLDDLAEQVADSSPPPVDLSSIEGHLDRLAASIEDNRPAPVDLSPVHTRLDQLTEQLRANTPEPVDLSGLTSSIAGMRQRIDALGADPGVDLTPIQTALAEVIDALAHQIDDGRTSNANTLAAIEVIADRVDEGRVDLAPIAQRLDVLAAEIVGSQPEPVDLTPVTAAVAELRTHLADSRIDIRPIQAQLDAMVDRADPAGLDARFDELRALMDLSPLRAGIAEVVEAGAVQLEATDRMTTELRGAIDGLAAKHAPEVDLAPVIRAVEEMRVHYDETQPDLNALIEAMKTLRTQMVEAIHDTGAEHRVDLTPLESQITANRVRHEQTFDEVRDDLSKIAEALQQSREEASTSLEHLQTALTPQPVDLDPVLESIAAMADRVSAAPDLTPIHHALEALRQDLPATVDLAPLHAAILDVSAAIPPATDLAPLHGAIADLSAAIPPSPDLGPVRDDLAAVRDAISSLDLQALHDRVGEIDLESVRQELSGLRSTVASSQPDLTPVRTSLADILDSLAQSITESRNSTERVVRAVSEIDTTPDLSEARTDLTPVLDALSGLERRLDDTSATDRVTAALDRVAGDVASARAEMARSETLDQLSGRLDSLQNAIDSLRADEALHEAELRLARRVDTNSEALRAKIDDQRVLADSLAANVSQLNAALTVASEEPQQLRRDLDRILEQLAERMGGAMRELRNELKTADEPLALRSSVEAGLDRITGRFQSDTGRILEAVSAAQEDADGRLRRIDNQVTELRRAVEKVRRDNDRFETVSPS